jgi:XamI restriction endonuclease
VADPRRWTQAELDTLSGEAKEEFRRGRTGEPLSYSDFFEAFVPIFVELIDSALPRLISAGAVVDQDLLAQIVSDEQARTAFRYLAAPPISDDDLKTLAETKLSAAALRTDPEEAARVRDTVLNVIDPHRFPWVGRERPPSEREREIAIVSSAVLVATQKVGTSRRGNAKRDQERQVKDLLSQMQFSEVPRREIRLLDEGPQPGQFCGESRLGDTRADLIVRLPDRRYLALECKVSNSAVNSFKRLNHEALGKARRWVSQFGTAQVVPAAILSGVFSPANLAAAQQGGLFLIWSHRLGDLQAFIESCRTTEPRRRRKE